MLVTQKRRDFKFVSALHNALLVVGTDVRTSKAPIFLKNYWKALLSTSCVLYIEWALINFVAHSLADIGKATRALSMANSGFLILVKSLVLLLKGKKFKKLFVDMNLLAEKANRKELKSWLGENRQVELIGNVYLYSCCGAACFCGTAPIAFMAYDYLKNNKFKQNLPLDVRSPFDNDNGMPNFMLHYILCMIFILALLQMSVGIDSLYGWYIYNLSAHFRILRCKIESVGLKLESPDYMKFNQDMGLIVNYHNRTLGFVDDLNDIFGTILWFEVTFSCLQMCFVIYTLNNDANFVNMPFNFMVLVAVLIQLMIYCFGGQKVKNESSLLCYDIYLCTPWHRLTKSQAMLMILPLCRSQKLSVLRGIFFEADNALMVFIIKTAFSFNTLLSALND